MRLQSLAVEPELGVLLSSICAEQRHQGTMKELLSIGNGNREFKAIIRGYYTVRHCRMGNGFEWWTVSGRHPHTEKLAVFSAGYFLRLDSCFSAFATANLWKGRALQWSHSLLRELIYSCPNLLMLHSVINGTNEPLKNQQWSWNNQIQWFSECSSTWNFSYILWMSRERTYLAVSLFIEN